MQSRLPPREPCQRLTQGKASRGLAGMDKSRTRAGEAAHLVLSAPAAIGKDIGVCWHSPLTVCPGLTWASAASRQASSCSFEVSRCPSLRGSGAGTAPLLPRWKRGMDEIRLGAAESRAGPSLTLGATSCLRIHRYVRSMESTAIF